MAILTVGVGQSYLTLTAAVQAANSDDIIQVQAGAYINDFPAALTKNLTLIGVGGLAHLLATVAPPNGKAILVTGAPGVVISIANFEFSNVGVADANGAGIRYEGGHLILQGCYFHDNQDGVLGGSDPSQGIVEMTDCEFANNGAGDGRSHNIYLTVNRLSLYNVYSHGALIGHELKSRAANTTIINSRFQNESGTASYCLDFPNGGNVLISKSTIQKGAKASNATCMIAYGEEGAIPLSSSLVLDSTILINDRSGLHEAVWNASTITALITRNTTWQVATMLSGSGTVSGITPLPTEPILLTIHPWLPTPVITKAVILKGIGDLQNRLTKLVTDISLL